MAGARGAAYLLRRVGARHCVPAARVLGGTCALYTTTQTTKMLPLVRSDHCGLAPASKTFQASNTWIGLKHMHSDISAVPELSDPQAKHALNSLLATNWSKIEKEVYDTVEGAIAKGGRDSSILSTVWSSARASELFADTLASLRMELDELSGSTGESVGRVPDTLIRALEAAFSKYTTYLEAISEDEDFLKKKVENDLGSILVQIKQRCSGLDPKWGKITLLGTSGLSGSYIERRHTP